MGRIRASPTLEDDRRSIVWRLPSRLSVPATVSRTAVGISILDTHTRTRSSEVHIESVSSSIFSHSLEEMGTAETGQLIDRVQHSVDRGPTIRDFVPDLSLVHKFQAMC